jgi:hypothetical protein
MCHVEQWDGRWRIVERHGRRRGLRVALAWPAARTHPAGTMVGRCGAFLAPGTEPVAGITPGESARTAALRAPRERAKTFRRRS